MKKTLWAALLLCLPAFANAQKKSGMSEIELSMRKLSMAQLAISSLYVDSVDTEKLTEDAINGMLSELDPHSSYTDAEETRKMNEPLKGNFDGIGVQFNMLEDTLIAGVKMARDEIMRRLRGPRGTTVRLGVMRGPARERLEFNVTRDKIPVSTVDAAFMAAPGVGLIRLSSFGSTSHDEMQKAIKDLQAKGMKDLILDLQQNGGGYMDAATNIASEFLPKNDLIVYTKGARHTRNSARRDKDCSARGASSCSWTNIRHRHRKSSPAPSKTRTAASWWGAAPSAKAWSRNRSSSPTAP